MGIYLRRRPASFVILLMLLFMSSLNGKLLSRWKSIASVRVLTSLCSGKELSRSYIKRFVWYNLYHSQSVFKFSLRLHYHTSCSYRVHKSCSYRVFSLQEFKQNDSRTSCSSSNYCTNFREKQVKKKEIKNESLCETLA